MSRPTVVPPAVTMTGLIDALGAAIVRAVLTGRHAEAAACGRRPATVQAGLVGLCGGTVAVGSRGGRP